MQLGNNKVPVYWFEEQQTQVIKVGGCGDNFGYVQRIDNHELCKTYGYHTLAKVDEIDVCVSIPSTTGFDAYEIKFVAEFVFGHCEPVQKVEEHALKHFWTLYGHLPEGGVEAIADLTTRDQAVSLYQRIQPAGLLPLTIEGPDVDPLSPISNS
ncbi:MAG: hypothetical protein C9356_11820 [Oleiphilus sp.]|nr:MAG: hypothetical protein C9356_11820 [Oleiphilus sp.]